MKARVPLLLLVLLAASFAACAKPINDGNACFQTSECQSGSICADTAYGKFCLKQCSPDVVRCENGESCLRTSDLGLGGAGGEGGAGGAGGVAGAGGVGGAQEEEFWVCLPGAGQLETSEILPRVTGQVCDFSIECALAHVCVCIPGATCTGEGRNGPTCQWLCDPTLINECPRIGDIQPECTDLGTGRGFCDPSTIQSN